MAMRWRSSGQKIGWFQAAQSFDIFSGMQIGPLAPAVTCQRESGTLCEPSGATHEISYFLTLNCRVIMPAQNSPYFKQGYKENTLLEPVNHPAGATPPAADAYTGFASTRPYAPEHEPTSNHTASLTFSGVGSEYFRIWIVNLLLILVTLGIYYPWAKVRKLKYFYSNTRLEDHPLAFHGEPKTMIRGYLLVGVLFLALSNASKLSALAGVLAALLFVGMAPVLFRAALRFRLANSSWRGVRMRFVAQGYREAYLFIAVPLTLLLLPSVVLGYLSSGDAQAQLKLSQELGGPIAIMSFLSMMTIPYFFWRMKRYQHNHYAWGPLTTSFSGTFGAIYKLFGKIVLMFMLLGVAMVPVGIMVMPSNLSNPAANLSTLIKLVPLIIVVGVMINVFARAFFSVRLQNLVWSATDGTQFQFSSTLPFKRFLVLQLKNYFLILITLGFYWPFAVVASRRMQLQAISLTTPLDLASLVDTAQERNKDAAGDMAADVFGLDVGF